MVVCTALVILCGMIQVVQGLALPLQPMFIFGQPGRYDHSVHGYSNERACWWNEICKNEFQNEFRCRCPQKSYCRSVGRYYNAHCSVMASGYIWTQPRLNSIFYRMNTNRPKDPESSLGGIVEVMSDQENKGKGVKSPYLGQKWRPSLRGTFFKQN